MALSHEQERLVLAMLERDLRCLDYRRKALAALITGAATALITIIVAAATWIGSHIIGGSIP